MDLTALITSLSEALELTPGNERLRSQLAALLMQAGRHPEAETHFKQLLAARPDDRSAKLGLARCYSLTGRNDVAVVVLEDLYGHGDRQPDLLVQYCHALVREGSLDRAVSVYKEHLRLHPERVDPELDDLLRPRHGPAAHRDGEEEQEGEGADRGLLDLIKRTDTSFKDVGGMDTVKDEIGLKIIQPLLHPEIYKAYGKKAGGGILLYGPPGCGKTHIARATAGEIQARFLSVGINDVLDMWMGNSEKRLHDVFELARKNAPCVVFFDEIDALGANRNHMRQSAGRHLINQFLSEMDGLEAKNEGLLVIGATNAPWHIDPAFRRPGRFDRTIFVPPPDRGGREAILRILLKDKPVQDVDIPKLAGSTDGFSGADLTAVLDLAIEDKLRTALGKGVPEPLTTKDLVKAAGKHRPTTREWFSTARNYALYANEGGLYDEILKYIK